MVMSVEGSNAGPTSTFAAPSMVRYDVRSKTGKPCPIVELLCTPSRPGHCLHSFRMSLVLDGNRFQRWLKGLQFKSPKWLIHQMYSLFINQVSSRSWIRCQTYLDFALTLFSRILGCCILKNASCPNLVCTARSSTKKNQTTLRMLRCSSTQT